MKKRLSTFFIAVLSCLAFAFGLSGCELLGEIEHKHVYGSWSQIVAPTCTTTGKESRACDTCDEKEEREVQALGHDYAADAENSKAPTCVAAGVNAEKCTRCGDVKTVAGDPINPTAHSYVADAENTKAPTCGEAGVNAEKCTLCGDVKTTVGDAALGHVGAELVEAIPATHTTAGRAAYYYCKTCDKKLDGTTADAAVLTDADLALVAMGHVRAELVEAIPATHTTAGRAAYYYCADCDKKFESRAPEAAEVTDEELVILPMGHIRAELVAAIPATHTTEGTAAYYYCADCKKKLDSRAPDAAEVSYEELVVLPMGHIRAEYVEAFAATHSTAGSAAYYYCADCDKKFDGRSPDATELTDEELAILPMGHIRAELVEAIPATHTEAGRAAYYYCADCDKKFESRAPEAAELTDEELVILPMGHIRAELVAAIPATHTEAGRAAYYYCADCDKKFESRAADAAALADEDLVLVAMGHVRAELVATVPATHTEAGMWEHYYCSVCDKRFDDRTPEAVELTEEELTILPMGHIRAEHVATVPATHTTAGMWEHWYCADCDAKFESRNATVALTEEELTILPLGHDRAELVEAIPATHTTAGVWEYWYCADCDAKFENRFATEALTDEELVIAPMGHIRAEKVDAVKATHSTNGNIEYYRCEECGKNYTDRSPEAEELTDEEVIILAQGHIRAELVPEVPATEDAVGTKAHYHCEECGKNYTDRSPEAAELTDEDLVIPPLNVA